MDSRSLCVQRARAPRSCVQVAVVGHEVEAAGELRDDGGIAELGVRAQLIVELSASAEGVLNGTLHLDLMEARDSETSVE